MADVVDLEDGEQNPAGIPEVQFIRATVRPDQSSARDHRFVDGSNLLDFLRLHPHRFSTASLGEEAIRQEVALHRHLMTPYQHAVEPLWIDPPEGFNPDLSSLSPPRPAPSYKPPSPAPEGFTRSAQDDEVVVCPNCEHELGTGDDVRQQIWVAKPCGHVRIRPFNMILKSYLIDSPFWPVGLLWRVCQKSIIVKGQKGIAENLQPFFEVSGRQLWKASERSKVDVPDISLNHCFSYTTNIKIDTENFLSIAFGVW